MSDAHEEIDKLITINALDKIASSSVEQIAHGKDLFGGQILYKGTTKGSVNNPDKNDIRYILRSVMTMPTQDVREQDQYNLMQQLQQGVDVDTLKASEMPDALRGMQQADSPSMLARLIDKIKGMF
tara:strand:+ start:2228 stop:2605 length:378 start_codon:yes stop_codon:yes gene_type:complete